MNKAGLLELQAVVAVATHRSFRRAAVELGLSPSALSHAVAALERRMGVRLFNRTTRSVALSEAGEQFLSRVRPALGEIATAMEAVNDFRETPSGKLRINSSEGAARLVMAPLVLAYLRRYPDMLVDLVTEDRLVDIVAEGFDAGIRLAETVPQDMIAVPCSLPLRFVVVGSPDHLARHGSPHSPADLLRHPCVRTRHASGVVYRWEFQGKGGEAIRIEVQGALTLDSHALLIDAALGGAGLIWISEFMVAEHIAAGRLVEVLKPWSPAYPGVRLYYPGHRHVPAGLRAFISLAREVFPAEPR